MKPLSSLIRFLNQTGGSVADKTTRSGIWVGLTNVFNNLIRFLTQVLVARLLLPEHIGLMGIALFFLRVLDVLSQPGLSAAIIHRTEDVRRAVDATWSALILRGLALAGVTFFVAPFAAEFYGQGELKDIIRVISCIYVIQGFANTQLIVLRKELDFKRIMLAEVVASLSYLIVVAWIATVYRTVWALVVGQVVMAAVRTAASFVIVRQRPRFTLDFSLLRKLFRYGKFVTGTTIVTFLTTAVDKAILGKLVGMTPLGYYVYAQSLAGLPVNNTVPVLQRVLFPALSQLQADRAELRRFYVKVLRLVAAVTLPTCVGIAILGREIVLVIYGERWLPLVAALYVLCGFSALRAVGDTNQPVFLALGKPHVSFYLSAVRLLLILGLSYPLTMRYGIVGMALAVTLPLLVEQLVMSLLVRTVLDCPLASWVRALWVPTFASAVMAAGVYGVKSVLADSPDATVLLAGVGAGCLIYVPTVIWIDPQLLREVLDRLKAAISG